MGGLEGLQVYYIAFDENSEYIKRVADFYNLKKKVFHKTDKPVSNEPAFLAWDKFMDGTEEREKNTPKLDVEAMFWQAGYKEVFSNLGYKGDWLIRYVKLFDFERLPQKFRAEYLAFTDKGLIYCKEGAGSIDAVETLPYDILKYLRIELRVSHVLVCEKELATDWIGHTFITMSDEKEEALVGADNVKLLKDLR